MLSRRRFIASALLSSLSLPRLLAGIKLAALPVDGFTGVRGIEPKSIIVVGDIQRTNPAEEWAIARAQNDNVREKIVQAVIGEHPDMLLLLGDQVSSGENESDWAGFDQIMTPITSAKIPTYAIIGNHDYGFMVRS